jgi:hypothetical protein
MTGAILETHVVAEVLKGSWHNGRTPNLYFSRDRDGNEIDLLIKRDNRLYTAEIWKTATPNRGAPFRGSGQAWARHRRGPRAVPQRV